MAQVFANVFSVLSFLVVVVALPVSGAHQIPDCVPRLQQCALERVDLLELSLKGVVQVTALRNKTTTMAEALTRLREEHLDVVREHGDVLREHLTLMDSYRFLQEAYLRLQKNYNDLEKKHQATLKDSSTRERNLRAAKKALRDQESEHLQVVLDTRKRQEQQAARYRKLKKNHVAVTAKLSNLEAKHNTLAHHHDALRQDYDNLREQYSKMQGIQHHNQNNLREALQEREDLTFNVKQKEYENKKLKTELVVQHKHKKQLVQTIRHLKTQFTHIYKGLKNKNQEMITQVHAVQVERDLLEDDLHICRQTHEKILLERNEKQHVLQDKDHIVQHFQRNLTHVSWEKEQLENYYTEALKQCLMQENY